MPKIVLNHLVKRWDGFYGVDDLNLTIDDNAFVTLLGPSGCGKTTTLRMIAGLETPTSGRITIGDQVVFDSERGIDVPPNKRSVGFLFQNYALWPNMTIEQNITFGLANINEDLPLVSDEAVRASRMLSALAKPADVRDLINDTTTRKGSIDEPRAWSRLADHYELTMKSAKELFGLGLHTSSDPVAAAARAVSGAQAALDAERKRLADQGKSLNEKFQIVSADGVLETAKRKLSKQEIELRARRVARMVKIGQFMDRYPSELSGGQQQRVAIARTLAPEPKVLFMDEPLSNLDAKLRLEMRTELQRLHHETGSTFVYVTHDQGEAMTLATKICLLDNAVLQQYDAPLDTYNKPTNLFTADFVGSPPINFVNAQGTQAADGSVTLSIFDGRAVTFTPSEPVNIDEWYAKVDAEAAEDAEYLAERARDKGFVKKENVSSVFRYVTPTVGDDDEIVEEREWTTNDYVLGIRPACVRVRENGAFEGEIHASMPTGLETTLQIKTGRFLLTSIEFGGVVYQLGEKRRFDLETSSIMLFSRKNGKLIGLGSLSAA